MNNQTFKQRLVVVILMISILVCGAPVSSPTPITSRDAATLVSSTSPQGPIIPKDGYWLNDPSTEYQITVLIKDSQIQWVDLSGSIPEGSLHCVFGKTPPTSIQPDGTFTDDDGGGAQISGSFVTPATGHIIFMFTGPWCSGTTTTGQPASFDGTVNDETDIKFDH